jgi:hypothetical protein
MFIVLHWRDDRARFSLQVMQWSMTAQHRLGQSYLFDIVMLGTGVERLSASRSC